MQLRNELRDKEMKLTDIRLEALSSAHQLDQLREAMNRMQVSPRAWAKPQAVQEGAAGSCSPPRPQGHRKGLPSAFRAFLSSFFFFLSFPK